jgi:hypothetical protein
VALDAYQKSLEIRKTLAANDPQSAQAQRDLFVSYTKLGRVNIELELMDTAQAPPLHLCVKIFSCWYFEQSANII